MEYGTNNTESQGVELISFTDGVQEVTDRQEYDQNPSILYPSPIEVDHDGTSEMEQKQLSEEETTEEKIKCKFCEELALVGDNLLSEGDISKYIPTYMWIMLKVMFKNPALFGNLGLTPSHTLQNLLDRFEGSEKYVENVMKSYIECSSNAQSEHEILNLLSVLVNQIKVKSQKPLPPVAREPSEWMMIVTETLTEASKSAYQDLRKVHGDVHIVSVIPTDFDIALSNIKDSAGELTIAIGAPFGKHVPEVLKTVGDLQKNLPGFYLIESSDVTATTETQESPNSAFKKWTLYKTEYGMFYRVIPYEVATYTASLYNPTVNINKTFDSATGTLTFSEPLFQGAIFRGKKEITVQTPDQTSETTQTVPPVLSIGENTSVKKLSTTSDCQSKFRFIYPDAAAFQKSINDCRENLKHVVLSDKETTTSLPEHVESVTKEEENN